MRAEVRFVLQRSARPRAAVAEHDLVDADVAPGAALVVHDLQPGRLARPARARPTRARCIRLSLAPVAESDDLAVDQQVDAGAAGWAAAADQEGDVVALDGERPAGQRAACASPPPTSSPGARRAS